jgi:hypothetical protein
MLVAHNKYNKLSGAKLCGGNPKSGRVEHDFYATNPAALNMLLDAYPIKGSCIEPCVGQGHLAEVIKSRVDKKVLCMDIVDRGYPGTIVQDFLSFSTSKKYSCIVTNPPFSIAEDFIRKSMSLLTEGGTCAMFLKIQFLEGEKRKELFEEFPPKYIYVFRKRMATWNNGKSLDPNGRRWQTTFCHAWFIFEKGNINETIIRWL